MSSSPILNVLQCLRLVQKLDKTNYTSSTANIVSFFAEKQMPDALHKFIEAPQYSAILHIFAINSMSKLTKGSYNDYQAIDIPETGVIVLHSHTLTKYEIAKKYITPQITSVLDAGCSLGGIGLKLANDDGISKVILDNITVSELETAKEIGGKLGLTNVEYTTEGLVSLDVKINMGLYFAIFHHLLRSHSFDDLMKLVIRQVSDVAVIELPIKGDALLANIVSTCDDPWNTRYATLASVESFKQAVSAYFTVAEHIKMDYGNGDLNRHTFVCYIKK